MRKWSEELIVGDTVLLAHGRGVGSSLKWPAFKEIYYGPCRVKREKQPRFIIVSKNGRHSRVAIHAHILVKV